MTCGHWFGASEENKAWIRCYFGVGRENKARTGVILVPKEKAKQKGSRCFSSGDRAKSEASVSSLREQTGI